MLQKLMLYMLTNHYMVEVHQGLQADEEATVKATDIYHFRRYPVFHCGSSPTQIEVNHPKR